MTQDEIIEMAMEAEFVLHGKPSEEESELFVCVDKDIVRFAKLVAAKATAVEREACAKLCEEFHFGQAPMMIQRAIRARGEA